ncbi:hypothetical protein Q5741_01200 [Paenibacillus sp. JX-17]|uniref:Uncharacterized protein n=1 Tax=Paenibacillus lacisoli TaxID=3064525 RepID=A0ABT9C708_9BACL|nr:hypothetical protein [Paenibacillus sp. JX-17]MDO7905026.1 hypothetical protein [Paenibacillus sp. JX-17]
MKLRVFPIVLTAIIMAVVLFGGWFLYRQMAIKSPLEKIVTQYPGVTSAQLDINQSTVSLKLDLKPETNISGLVDQIKKEGKSMIGSRTLKLDVVDHSNSQLDQWWSEAMFPVAEAMENRKYTEIRSALEQLEHNNRNIKIQTAMDDSNVYVSLSEGKASKFIILPREAQKMGVWPNA